MNRLIFEGRFLVNMVGNIIRQDNRRASRRRIDWEGMFRTADYHKIANIVYLGVLGNEENAPKRWREQFFERYRESLIFGAACEEEERKIPAFLERLEVPCIILTTSKTRDLYQRPEMSGNPPLRLLLDEESYTLVKGYLETLNYETEQLRTEYGERMKHISGFCVELYKKLPFCIRPYEKSMRRFLESACLLKGYNYVKTLSPENRFVFMAAQAVYHYVEDGLLIREILDLYLYHKRWREEMAEEYVSQWLAELKIDEIFSRILQIAYMWFGIKEEILPEEQPEDIRVFDVLENRILSRDGGSAETSRQALRLAYLIRKETQQEKSESFGLSGVLLPVYWIRGRIRLLADMIIKHKKGAVKK